VSREGNLLGREEKRRQIFKGRGERRGKAGTKEGGSPVLQFIKKGKNLTKEQRIFVGGGAIRGNKKKRGRGRLEQLNGNKKKNKTSTPKRTRK